MYAAIALPRVVLMTAIPFLATQAMPHIISGQEASIAIYAAGGSFVWVVVTGQRGWGPILGLFGVGLITAEVWTIQVAMWLGWGMDKFQIVAFCLGAIALVVWGVVAKLAQNFHEDPFGTVAELIRLWRGRNGVDK